MDELACFAPGMLALEDHLVMGQPGDSENFLSLAEELAWTCYNFYKSTPTKLAGESYFFHSGEDKSVGTLWNILRLETVESLSLPVAFNWQPDLQRVGLEYISSF